MPKCSREGKVCVWGGGVYGDRRAQVYAIAQSYDTMKTHKSSPFPKAPLFNQNSTIIQRQLLALIRITFKSATFDTPTKKLKIKEEHLIVKL